MPALIDTHAFLWLISDDGHLTSAARSYLQETGNSVYLSVASAWEIAIKVGRGRLQLDIPLQQVLTQILRQFSLSLLPITPSHLVVVASLPHHHRDPFDRMIIAQCIVEKLPLVSADQALDAYGITRIW